MVISRVAPLRRVIHAVARGFATQRKTKGSSLTQEVLDVLPVFGEIDAPASKDPGAYHRNPVTSAHCIDVEKQQVSTLDSAALSPTGSVLHGQYGDLGSAAQGIPLEFLALLRPAAEGAAGLRVLAEKTSAPGTLLVYGASQPQGFAASQLASSVGHAVVAVVGGEHSGNETMMETVKGLVGEPGTAVPEEYALSKKKFAELVKGISTGDEGIATVPPEKYLEDFKANLLAYSEAYPDTRPAAVSKEHMEFKYMEKDREFWEQNMEAFLEQYPPGSPPVDKAKLDAFFTTEQYEIFRKKFWKQTTGVISGDDTPFSAPHLVKKQLELPETPEKSSAGLGFPYAFSVTNQFFPADSKVNSGGPILGAIIAVTPNLKVAAEKVAAAKTLRAKGEALQFLTHSQKAAFGAACSVASQARKAGAPVVVVGGALPEVGSVEVAEADIKEALTAMDIDDSGASRLNFFVQVYRASDFPFYADYAIHRASEELAGPRQIIVTK